VERVARVIAGLEALSEVDRQANRPTFGRIDLVVDATGVGLAVVDLFRERRLRPVAVTIVAGDRQTEREDGVISVGKGYLIGKLQVLLQAGRLHLPSTPEAAVLVSELQDYQLDYTPAGNVTFNARSGQHDDLVLALALAVAVDVPPPRGVPLVTAIARRQPW
jgi:hypothetical protein